MSVQTCIILAGGLGTRLSAVVADRPKCLALVGPRSFLDIQLEAMAACGISHFVLSLGHQADLVIAAVEKMSNRYQIDCVIEPARLGTGGGILFTMQDRGLTEVVVTNGDTYVDSDLSALLIPLALARGERMRIAAINVEDRSRFGGLRLDGGRVTGFLEKGASGSGPINAGTYRVHRSIFEPRKPGDAFSLETDVMPDLVHDGALTAAEITGDFIDIGVPDDYFRFCREHGRN